MLTLMFGGFILDCVGEEPLENRAIVVEDGIIRDVVSNGWRPKSSEVVKIDLKGRTVLPGLIDAHQHPALVHLDIHRSFTDPPMINAAKMQAGLARTLDAGFTTVADMGMAHSSLREAVEQGYIAGPRILLACSMLSKTGGHGDFSLPANSNGLPLTNASILTYPRLVDGPDDARKAVREQIRMGAHHIKAMATGGASSPNDRIEDMGFSEQELQAIVDEAAGMGRYVSVHALNDAGAARAVACGVRSVDHGAFMTEATALQMKEKCTYHVPTLTIAYLIKTRGKDWVIQDYLEKKTREVDLLEAQIRSTVLTRKLGVKIGSGSDAIGEIHGLEGYELKLKTECGFTPYEAIKSATCVNAELLGLSDELGTVEPGKWADLIVVAGRPEQDAGRFCSADNIHLVMKGGRVMKNLIE